MRKKRTGVCLVIACLAWAPVASRADDPGEVAARLRVARSEQEVDALVGQLDGQRRALTRSLGALLRGPRSSAVKAHACYLLGLFGDLEDTEVLMEHIDLRLAPGSDRIGAAAAGAASEARKLSLFWVFPCEEALVRLGDGVTDRIVRLIAGSDNMCRRELGAQTLAWVDGWEASAAVVRAAAARTKGTESNRLRDALGFLEKGPTKGPFPCSAARKETGQ
jgi:hypothetical protein